MIAYDQMPEHEFEAEMGLPQALPRGERLLWQGAPDWRVMANDAMHLRAFAAYFGLILAWRGASVWFEGGTPLAVTEAVLWLLPPALLALGLLTLLAWLVSRTSVYTITDKRVVMRIGIVLSITFNLPYKTIDAARLQARADGSGDVCLSLAGADQIAYVHLWPHARAWHVKRTEPMLRAVPNVRAVAALLSTALAESAGAARLPSPWAQAARNEPHAIVGAADRATATGALPLAA